MATIESWSTLTMTEVGPLYPMVGSEGLWLTICVVLWVVWHIKQTKMESKAYEDQIKRFGDAETLKNLVAKEDPEHP